MDSFDRLFKAKILAAHVLQDDGAKLLSLYLERASIYEVGGDFEVRAVPVRFKNQEGPAIYRPVFTLTGEYVNLASIENVRDLLLQWARAKLGKAESRDNSA